MIGDQLATDILAAGLLAAVSGTLLPRVAGFLVAPRLSLAAVPDGTVLLRGLSRDPTGSRRSRMW